MEENNNNIQNNSVETSNNNDANIPYNIATYEEDQSLSNVDKPTNEYPEGFDATTFNLETGQLRIDAIRDLLKEKDAQIQDYKSQKDNLRRIISKGKQPITDEQFASYKPDSKYEKMYEDNEMKELVKDFNYVANGMGLNQEQHKQVLDFINAEIEKMGIFDLRSDAEKQIQLQDFRNKEFEKLGGSANAQYIIKKNMDFIKSYNFLNEDQKQALCEFANQSASNLMAINRFREVLDQNIGEESPIPTMNVSGNNGLSDDATLWEEFKNPNTTERRRQEILNQRMNAGRPLDFGSFNY